MKTKRTRRCLSTVLCLVLCGVIALTGSPARAQTASPALPELVDRETVKAIERALKYLQKTQRSDGGWNNSGGYGSYPMVMSSLAGLAMLASGSTPREGVYNKNVRRAMLKIIQTAETHTDGLIAGGGNEYQSMYGHGFAMLFLAECYGMETTKEYQDRIRKVLDKAVDLTARVQSDLGPALNHAGGWIYTPTSSSDEGSVTVTQLQALRACRNVGIKVPKSTIDRAVAYLKYCQQADGGICYSAASRGQSRPAISAAGVACFYSAGVYDQARGGSGDEAAMVEKLVAYCRTNVRVGQDTGGHYFYTHLYYGQAMYQRGGKDWQDYYPAMAKSLRETQSPDGTWNGDSVGTTYGTAIGLLIMQQPFAVLPIYQR